MPTNASSQVIADYLLGGYNDHADIAYTFFDPNAAGPITVNLGGLDAEGQQLAIWAMDAWESVSGVDFEVVRSGGALTFQDHGSGAYAQSRAYFDGRITSATINVDSGWIDKYGAGVDSFTFRTYMHEIGHVLGLGHTGPYNGSADYGDAIFSNDSWQMSVMSYFGQDENPTIDASRASNVMPMEADLLAIRKMWGAPETHYADGDTIWGIGSKLDNYLGDMFRGMANHEKSSAYDLQPITLYIEDGSGHDRIDFSHTGLHQTVDLRPGAVSSVLSFSNNMLITKDTIIEDFVSGDGIDTVIGNAAGNSIWGGGRDDLLKGLGGNDTLWGEAGKDRLLGGSGKDALHGGEHDDLLRGQGGRDELRGEVGADKLHGNAGSDRLWGGSHSDTLNGGFGHDKLWGETGSDTLISGGGNDELYGGDQSDILRGDAGNDLLDGGDAGDLLKGGTGNDTLFGGDGLDKLYGDSGDDWLDGGTAADLLFGGAGADVFVLRLGYGTETVGDFEIGQDRIALQFDLMVDLSAESASALCRDTDEGDLMLNFREGNRMLLTGLAGNDLGPDTFIFV
ncbi:MAG: M10 family metallopeptidase C-terminal domain-containing protein [Limimaricola soesokkakensis]|uniref:M10 family metallopeptidase C-terminal domain-containing protein n=1 Tax=Limimaricola soesokkakensis TaxID=1343159 RepID=UPI0040586583